MELLGDNRRYGKFRIKADLEDEQTGSFISFLRFLHFDEDIEVLRQAVLNAKETADESTFTGKFLPVLSPKNELYVWCWVKQLLEEALGRYLTTLK